MYFGLFTLYFLCYSLSIDDFYQITRVLPIARKYLFCFVHFLQRRQSRCRKLLYAPVRSLRQSLSILYYVTLKDLEMFLAHIASMFDLEYVIALCEKTFDHPFLYSWQD